MIVPGNEPLDRMPPSGPMSIQSRFLYMTEADWRGLAAALESEFPLARYRAVSREGSPAPQGCRRSNTARICSMPQAGYMTRYR